MLDQAKKPELLNLPAGVTEVQLSEVVSAPELFQYAVKVGNTTVLFMSTSNVKAEGKTGADNITLGIQSISDQVKFNGVVVVNRVDVSLLDGISALMQQLGPDGLNQLAEQQLIAIGKGNILVTELPVEPDSELEQQLAVRTPQMYTERTGIRHSGTGGTVFVTTSNQLPQTLPVYVKAVGEHRNQE